MLQKFRSSVMVDRPSKDLHISKKHQMSKQVGLRFQAIDEMHSAANSDEQSELRQEGSSDNGGLARGIMDSTVKLRSKENGPMTARTSKSKP